MSLDQLFMSRPTSQLSNYRGPIQGLYLGGSGAHPGTLETGEVGYLFQWERGLREERQGLQFHSVLVGVITYINTGILLESSLLLGDYFLGLPTDFKCNELSKV